MAHTLEKLEANMRNLAAQFVENRIGAREDCRLAESTMAGARPSREKLMAALRRERMKARSGSARYDFNRHIALHQAMMALERSEAAAAKVGE